MGSIDDMETLPMDIGGGDAFPEFNMESLYFGCQGNRTNIYFDKCLKRS